MEDVFISYSRQDKAFVTRLHEALKARQRGAWVDLEDIPPTAEWREKIKEGIEGARAFVFVLSPDSMASPECLKEVEHAVASHKRLIPVVCREVETQAVPEVLNRLNWIFLREQDDFENGMEILLTAVDTNLEWVDAHTNLLEKTAEWGRKGRDKSLLLRGGELREAEGWQVKSAEKEPKPTELMAAFIVASRQGETRRQRYLLGGVSAGLVVAMVLALVAYFQYREADRQYQEADRRGKIALSRQLALQSQNMLESKTDLALLLSVEAHSIAPTVEAKNALLTNIQKKSELIKILQGHKQKVRALAFTSSGKIVAAAGGDTIIIWEIIGKQPAAPVIIHYTKECFDLSFHPDGNLLALYYPQEIKLWDLAQGRFRAPPLEMPEDFEARLRFSPNGDMLAGIGGKSTWIWDLKKRMVDKLPIGREGNVAFSPDSQFFVGGAEDGSVEVWDTAHKQFLPSWPTGHDSPVVCLAFTPNGRILATGSKDGSIRFTEVASGKPLGPPLHTEEPLDAITFSANGELLASASNGIVQLWRLDRREMLTKLSLNPLLLFTFTPDHKLVGLSGPNAIKDPGELNVWRGESVSDFTPALPQLGNAMLHCAAVSPDGAMLVTGAEDGSVRLWNLASRLQLGLVLTGHYEEVDSVKFSIDGQWMVSEGKDGVIFWNTVSREPWGPPFLTKNQYREAVFSKDGKYLAVVEGKNIVRLWDMVLQRFLDTTLGTFEETVNHLVFSPDGKVLAIQSGENLSFWDIPQLQPINAFLKGFNFPRFSPDSTLFAATGVEGDRVWDVPHFRGIELPLQGNVKIVLAPGGRLYIKPRAENGSSNQADEIPWRLWDMANRQFIERPIKLMADSDQMSPDGRLLLMPGEDEGIRLYDVARQEVLNPPLKGHKNFGDFVFSPDSKILASTPGPLSDADIRLWDIETLQPLGQPFGGSVMYPRNPVFSPDGKILAAAYRFGVILWDMDVESWKRRACRMANRNLTMEEWKQYLGDRSYHNTCPDLPGAKEGKGAQ